MIYLIDTPPCLFDAVDHDVMDYPEILFCHQALAYPLLVGDDNNLPEDPGKLSNSFWYALNKAKLIRGLYIIPDEPFVDHPIPVEKEGPAVIK